MLSAADRIQWGECWKPVVEHGIQMRKWDPPSGWSPFKMLSARERWVFGWRAARSGRFEHQYLTEELRPWYDRARELLEIRDA